MAATQRLTTIAKGSWEAAKMVISVPNTVFMPVARRDPGTSRASEAEMQEARGGAICTSRLLVNEALCESSCFCSSMVSIAALSAE